MDYLLRLAGAGNSSWPVTYCQKRGGSPLHGGRQSGGRAVFPSRAGGRAASSGQSPSRRAGLGWPGLGMLPRGPQPLHWPSGQAPPVGLLCSWPLFQALPAPELWAWGRAQRGSQSPCPAALLPWPEPLPLCPQPNARVAGKGRSGWGAGQVEGALIPPAPK